MAAQVADGFILMTSHTLRGYLPAELNLLRGELDKQLRETRATVTPPDDALAAAARNRKIARISSALQVVANQIQTR